MKTFLGTEHDGGNSITTTPDGGYGLTGTTYSNDGDFIGMNKGEWDIFAMKLDSRGEIQWKKTFGGSRDELGNSITTTPDGGFVLTGYTYSNDGDFDGMKKGNRDIFVIKLDSRGNVQWKKTFGGIDLDCGYSITTTPDVGYVLTGWTKSDDDDFKDMNKGEWDIFVIKLDSVGDIQWRKTLGGNERDYGYSITTIPDGSYVLTGGTNSFDGDFDGMNKGRLDIFIIRLDSHGDVQWKTVFGGKREDIGCSITTTPDGGYVLTGETNSDDGDFKGMNKGGKDIFVIKLDSRGDVEWKKTFGGGSYDSASSITRTPDGSYVLTGWTSSYDSDFKGRKRIEGNIKGESNIFVIKVDSNGNLQSKGKKSKKK